MSTETYVQVLITCASDRYAIPQVSLVELVRLEGEDAHKRIETIHGAPVYRLRGNLLPLVYLSRELNVHRPTSAESENDVINIVVLQADDRQFGLVVEGINDTEEIVVKPLGKQLKDLSVFAGSTIMGDGKVALILDVLGLAQRTHVVSETRERAIVDSSRQSKESATDHEALLLFQNPDGGRMAIPLSRVARLEKFPRSVVEKAGQRDVVQYRDQIMPLIYISSVFSTGEQWPTPSEGDDAVAEEELEVIVHTNNEQCVGLVVD